MFSSPASDLQRPLAMLSFAINTYFTGMDPVAMKLTSIGVHAVNGVLVFLLVSRLLTLGAPTTSAPRRRWASLFIALAWTFHPIQLTAVLYVVQRMESLCHTFVFLGLLLYLAGRTRQIAGRPGWGRVLTGLVVCAAIGTLSKESAALLPLYAFLIEACVLRFATAHERTRHRLWAVYGFVLILPAIAGGTWLLLHSLAPGAYSGRDFTMFERLLTEGRVLVDYLRWTLFPSLRAFGLYHDDFVISRGWLAPATTLASWLFLVALAIVAVLVRRRRPLTSLGIAWFLAAHALTASFLPLELVYEHRNYFASLGVLIAMGDLLLLAPSHAPTQRIGGLLAIAALLFYTAGTFARAHEWGDPYRLAASEAARHPESPRATYGLGRMLVIMTRYRADSPYVQPAFDALEQSRRLPASGVLPHSAYLLLAEHIHHPIPDLWWDDFAARLRTRPLGPQEMNAVASLVHCSRSRECDFPPQRIESLFEAADSQGPRADMVTMHGDYLLNARGERDRALALWQQAVALAPTIAQYRINLVKLLITMGRYDEARAQIAEIRRLGAMGQYEKAATDLETRMANAQLPPAAPATRVPSPR
jgi:tetratricopeptide (TPR) repeat protein